MSKEFEQFTMYEACLLHARADRALRTVVSSKLEGLNITMMEWLLLGIVVNGPEKGLSMSSVAHSLNVTLPQVTALVSNLVKQKLVRQKTQSYDRRSRHVMASPKGKALLEQIEISVGDAIKEWLKDIPETQLLAYMETVKHLAMK